MKTSAKTRPELSKFSATVCLSVAVMLYAGQLYAHSGENHDDKGVSLDVGSEKNLISEKSKFPLQYGGAFALTDHHGNSVTNRSYKGKHMLVFFGYASCKNMCSLSLGRIGKALELVTDVENEISPLIITVDPKRDTPNVMEQELGKYHPQLIGLTGSDKELQTAYEAFEQKPVQIEDDWNNDAVFSHSSYFYLLDETGKFVTLFPPILNPESMAKIMQKHIS